MQGKITKNTRYELDHLLLISLFIELKETGI